MNFKLKKLSYIIFLIMLASCGAKKLSDVETLGGFRVLAIQTQTPELTQSAGLTVTARPYISDISSGGRSVTGIVEGCIDPGVGSGAQATCTDNPSRVFANYSVDTSTLPTMKSGWGSYSSALAIPDTIFSGKSSKDKFNGVAYLIIFTFTVDGTTYKSFRRIMVTNKTALNTNPTLTSLNLNGGSMAKPKNGDFLSATYSGAETYDYIRSDGVTENRTEKLSIAWYVSAGVFDMPTATAAESVQYKSDPPTGQLLIIGVLRDDRGGVTTLENLL